MRITPLLEIKDFIMEMGGEDAYKCYQCGKCMSICPWAMVEGVELPVYRIPQSVRLGISTSSKDKEVLAREIDDVFRCVGCEACIHQCPHGVNIPNILRAIRRILVEYGNYPAVLKPIFSMTRSAGSPLGQPHESRANWAKDLEVPLFRGEMEFLYFPGCFPAHDPRCQLVAQATAKILKKGKVSFGILGKEEWCCGEAIRRMGAEKLYDELATANITAFKNAGVKKIITTSPHCYTTFKNDYPEFDGEFKIYHTTQIFSELIREGKIVPHNLSSWGSGIFKGEEVSPLPLKVVYHDPCSLGRQNGIYDEPREVIKSIPGLELIEIVDFCREFAICCGGGSGGLWLDWPKQERMSNVRVKQASVMGAKILAVACPYCLMMFEDSVKVLGLDLEVKDISELLVGSIL